MRVLEGKNGGFMIMIFSFLGLVLATTMFKESMTYFAELASFENASAYIAYEIAIQIAPAIILLGILGASAFGYRKGYVQATEAGVNGLLLTVFGFLEIILFLALFPSIMTALEAVRTLPTIADYIALQVVVQIVPVVLFLGGLFAGGATVVGGVKQFRKKRAGATAN